jgi:hypothetical protein
MLTRGHACPRTNCKVRMHNACYETYRRSNGKCPICGDDWGRVGNDNVKPVGEAAAPKDEWPRRTRRTATASEDEQGDEADADADADADELPATAPDPPAPSQQPPVRRNQQRTANAR